MKFLFSVLFLAFTVTTFSQVDDKIRCDYDTWLEEMEETNPEYIQQIEKSFEIFKKQNKSGERINITIPVHVIIVHPSGQPVGTGSNFSMEHVQSQIDVLNQDFGRYNSDAGNTPPEFPAADTGIQFCLATVDPEGNPTDGITRYPFDGAFHPNASAIREETRWPRESYSNIWSAPNLPYLGLASVPSTFGLPSPNNDFIHVDAATFGGPGYGTQTNYNLGRTTTHEMGHWLGLFHVWGNGGCGSDDNISDTPLQNDSNFGCPNHPSPSCGNAGDMFMNYMDYVNDNCMNAFTQEQGDYMNTILSTSRASLNGSSFTACATSVPLVLNIISQEDPSCSDTNDGFILAEASGGSPDYSYSIDGSVPTPNNLFSDLSGGTYTIEVFDADGNSAVETVFLNTPLPLTATVSILDTNFCPSDINASVQIQVAGGSNPYTYSLNMDMPQSSNTFNDLANGFYVVNIVDNNGCMLDVDFELSSETQITITIDSTINLICSNDDMGLIIASAEGGNGPLSYSIDGINFQDTGEFTELDGGSYFVFAQDSVGCYDSLEVTLTEPDPFFMSVQSTDATCFGFNDGFAEVTAFGGNGSPYQYSFDSITFGDATMLDSLFAGDYDLYALDSLGCLAIATFDIDEPDEIQIIADTIINVTCFGDNDGMMSLSTTGGNGGYIYIFQGDSTATADFDNLEAGTYEVFVVDSLGCEGSAMFEIGVNSTIAISVSNEQVPSCFGASDGSIEVSASNTQGTIMYSIDGGTLQASPIFTGLSMGTYLIEVVDDTGCSAAITVSLGEPALLELLLQDLNNVSCNGANDGNVNLFVTGGTEPYTYSYSPDGTDPTGLAPGDYFLTVTDANGCAVSYDFTITEPEVLELNIITHEEIDCETGMGALLELEAIGGNGGYEFVVSNSYTTLSSEDGVFDALPIGSYQASVTDSEGCVVMLQIEITLENMFFAELVSVTDILCFAENGGAVEINVSGGMGNITYLLDAALEVDPSNLDTHAGDHTITVVDENECMIELLFTLEEPNELVVDDMVFDDGADNVTVLASGGVEPYMYSFDGGDTFTDNNVTEDLGDGTITVIVRGCQWL